MKKLFVIPAVLFLSLTAKAQMAVYDPAATQQLTDLNYQIASLNSQVSALNTTSTSSKLEQINTQKNTLDQLGLSKEQEKLLWQVSDYLKRGKEIQSILGKEKAILSSIQQLNTFVSQKNLPSGLRSDILQRAYSLMTPTGDFVDTALKILTNNQFRMSDSERRSYLTQIDNSLGGVLKTVQNLRNSANSYNTAVSSSDTAKQNYLKAIRAVKQ